MDGVNSAGPSRAHLARVAAALTKLPWREVWSSARSAVFYWNARTGETAWNRPADFWSHGVQHIPLWRSVQREENGKTVFVFEHRVTGAVSKVRPVDYDGSHAPVSLWSYAPDLGIW